MIQHEDGNEFDLEQAPIQSDIAQKEAELIESLVSAKGPCERPELVPPRPLCNMEISADVYFTQEGMQKNLPFNFYVGSKFAAYMTNAKGEVVLNAMDSVIDAIASLRAESTANDPVWK